MRFKLFVLQILTLGLFGAAVPALTQSLPAYEGSEMLWTVGVGPSIWNPDMGHGWMYGGAFWADWYSGAMPSPLYGLGMEAEARDISLGNSPTSQKNVRQDTAEGGVIYAWRHFPGFHPYGKFLVGFGSMDFPPQYSPQPYHSHDTRILLDPGAGVEYRIYHHIWVRGDYEYQSWSALLGRNFHPQGVTVGIVYEFSRHPVHRAPF